MQATVLGGPPTFTIASLRRRTVSRETLLAEGCGLNTTVFPAATIPIELQMIVEEGFVTGVIAPMTPNGAGSTRTRPWSPDAAAGVSSSGPGVLFVTRRFFRTLSSTRPRPVSSTASAARECAFSRMVSRIDSMISCRFSRPRASRALNATAAAATASSRLEKTPPPAEGGGGPAPASGMISLAMTSARRRSCSGLYAELMCQPAPWSGASVSVLGRALLEEGLAADLPGVHYRHDDRVARAVLGDLGLAG